MTDSITSAWARWPRAYLAQQRDAAAASLSFDERLGMLVDAEQLARENRALRRRVTEAKLRMTQACLEDLDYSGRKLDRAVIRQLATCRWVAEHHNVLITGPTGVGKTFLACALGQQACRQSQRVIYRRIPRLFPELTLAHGDGTYHRAGAFRTRRARSGLRARSSSWRAMAKRTCRCGSRFRRRRSPRWWEPPVPASIFS